MKKKIIYLSVILVLVISVITLSSIYKSKDNKYKKEYNTIPKEMAIMIKEEGATDYTKSTSKDIPKGNYSLNEEKTYCENNGKVTNYDSTTGTVSLNFVGSDRCYLYFDYFEPGYITILNNNGGKKTIEAKSAPNFYSEPTENEGMYAAVDDLGTSYYFRGTVDNNWLQYGEYTQDMYNCNDGTISSTDSNNSCTKIASKGDKMYWRIVRINGDNTIRLVYSGITAPTEDTKVVMNNGTLGFVAFNSGGSKAEHLGYMYTIGQQHGLSENSTVKSYLDEWYIKYTNLNTLKVADQIFCNDRTASTVDSTNSTLGEISSWSSTGSIYYFRSYFLNYYSWEPILICSNNYDRFTVNKINNIGNSALTYPVGLLTSDETIMAGSVTTGGSQYYLANSDYYWLITPVRFTDSSSGALIRAAGGLSHEDINSENTVRPVIALPSNIKLSGDGTWNNVYKVVTDDSTENTSSGKSFDTVFAANNSDIFEENGLRYEGSNPNNYICLDNQKSGSCASSSLLFRIIGLFDEDTSSDGTSSSGTKKLLKVIDTNNYGEKYWDSSNTNNWSKSTLQVELNDTYLTNLTNTANVNSKLTSAIANAKWHLGGASSSNYKTLTADGMYTEERNTSAIFNKNPSSIFAKVGIMYPSDYGYATVGGTTTNRSGCRAIALMSYDTEDCKNNDWLYTSQITSWGSNAGEWFLSPYSSDKNLVARLKSSGSVSLPGQSLGIGYYKDSVRPTFYLDSSILKILGTGDGTKDNAYRLG